MTPKENRSAPVTLPPIKITIKPEDFRTIRAALKAIPFNDRRELGQDIRNRAFNVITTARSEFLGIVATFAKYTSENRDRDLIKEMLFLEDEDLQALIEQYVLPDSLDRMLTRYEITGEGAKPDGATTTPAADATDQIEPQLPADLEQGELFPQEKPKTYDVDFDERFHHKSTTNIEICRAGKMIEEVARENAKVKIKVSAPKKKKQVVEMSVVVPDTGVMMNRRFTLQDKITEEAVANLYEQLSEQQENKETVVITPQMVYRQINGMTDGARVTPAAAERIDARIEKLCRTWINLDYTEQMPRDPANPLKRAVISGNIIDGVNCYARFANGEVVSAWRIKGLPKLYRYSKDIGQIAQIPMKLLNTSGAIRSTEEVQVARYYLIQQIEFLKKKHKTPPRVLFDTLFNETGDTAALEKRDIKSARIKGIKAILDYFAAEKYIKGYSIVKEAGVVRGVDIFVNSADEKKL